MLRIGLRLLVVLLTLSAQTGIGGCAPTAAESRDFSLQTHDGQTLTLSELTAKGGVVLVFFASWCQVCSEQVPSIKQLVESSKGANLAVVGVSIQEEAGTIASFVKTRELTYPVLLDRDTKVAAGFGIEGIPTIIGIDRSGAVAFRDHVLPKDTTQLIEKLTHAGP